MQKLKLSILIGVLITCLSLPAQHPDSLVRKGIAFQQRGEYSLAIQKYQEVLRSSPHHPQAHYELALAFFSLKEYHLALDHSNAVLNQANNSYQKGAYLVKGSALDNLGRASDAMTVYELGIKKFPDNYLLYYNLGLSAFNNRLYKKAERAVIGALQLNPNHASSHLLLGHLMVQTKQRIPAMLALYYFLMLEPESARSPLTYQLLLELKEQLPGKNRISTSNPAKENMPNFQSAELLLNSLYAAQGSAANRYKSEFELFAEHTQAFFAILGSISDPEPDFWIDMYTAFFAKMAAAGHAKAFAYHICQSSNQIQVQQWLDGHPSDVQALINWVRYYE